MKKVLVTGASGFIGRLCVPLLAAKNYTVHAVTQRRHSFGWPSNVSVHETDLLRSGNPAQLVRDLQPEAILHLAWCTSPGEFRETRENLDWVRASLELFGAFADSGGERIVAAGSCAQYASNAGECVEDHTPIVPATLYGICKASLESILRGASQRTGLSSAWGRVFFMFGPGEHPSRLVASTVRSLLRGEPARCSDGRQTLDFLYIEDVAAAFVALLESDVQGPVNIASGRPVAVRDVLCEIGRQLGGSDKIQFGSRTSDNDTARLWANTARLETEVGWLPGYTLAAGIAKTIEWWRESSRASESGTVEGRLR